jgi:hypothetical protein
MPDVPILCPVNYARMYSNDANVENGEDGEQRRDACNENGGPRSFGFRRTDLFLCLDWRQKNKADQQEKKCPSFSHTQVPALMRRLFADTTFSTVFRTVFAVLAVLAGVTRVGTCASR